MSLAKMISLRVSDHEHRELRRRARRAGLPLSEFVRRELSSIDALKGIVDVAAYGPQPVTFASGGSMEAHEGRFVYKGAHT